MLSGVVVVFFRFVLEYVLEQVLIIYRYQVNHLWIVHLWFIVLIVSGWATDMLVKKQPAISGSGILHQGRVTRSPESSESAAKIILEVPIHHGYLLDGLSIKEFSWPAQCLIVSVKRGSQDIIPYGDLILRTGDYLTILTGDYNVPVVNESLGQAANISQFQ